MSLHVGKSDMGMYRRAGAAVIKILAGGGVTERASVDECYVDLSQKALERLEQWMEKHGGVRHVRSCGCRVLLYID